MSAGDTLRDSVTEFPHVQEILSQGKLVPESITKELLTRKIQKICKFDQNKNILLEGYPRSHFQAQVVLEWLNTTFGDVKYTMDNVLGLHLLAKDHEIIERLKGRLIHDKSGRTYHTKFRVPKVDNVDDITGEPLNRRTDDMSDQAVQNRINTYKKETLPVIDFLKSKKIKIIDIPSSGIEDVSLYIQNQLNFHHF